MDMTTRQVSINVPTFLQYAPCPYEVSVEPHPLFLKLELMWRVFEHQFERKVFCLEKKFVEFCHGSCTAVRCSSWIRNMLTLCIYFLAWLDFCLYVCVHLLFRFYSCVYSMLLPAGQKLPLELQHKDLAFKGEKRASLFLFKWYSL